MTARCPTLIAKPITHAFASRYSPIGVKKLPSEQYRRLFFAAHEMNRERMARDCLILAQLILQKVGSRPTLVSLARAGTPVGAIVAHILRRITAHAIPH